MVTNLTKLMSCVPLIGPVYAQLSIDKGIANSKNLKTTRLLDNVRLTDDQIKQMLSKTVTFEFAQAELDAKRQKPIEKQIEKLEAINTMRKYQLIGCALTAVASVAFYYYVNKGQPPKLEMKVINKTSVAFHNALVYLGRLFYAGLAAFSAYDFFANRKQIQQLKSEQEKLSGVIRDQGGIEWSSSLKNLACLIPGAGYIVAQVEISKLAADKTMSRITQLESINRVRVRQLIGVATTCVAIASLFYFGKVAVIAKVASSALAIASGFTNRLGLTAQKAGAIVSGSVLGGASLYSMLDYRANSREIQEIKKK